MKFHGSKPPTRKYGIFPDGIARTLFLFFSRIPLFDIAQSWIPLKTGDAGICPAGILH
jgi:hypothetical protein